MQGWISYALYIWKICIGGNMVCIFQKSIRENPYVPTTELMRGETADAEKIETIKKVVESYRASFAENKFPS